MRITIVAASARWLAESCSRAGWKADAIDLYGDQDLQECCPSRQASGLEQALEFALQAKNPVLFGTGYETLASSVPPLIFPAQTLNTPPQSVGKCRDVLFWPGLLRQAGHVAPEHCGQENPEGNREWLVKPVVGAGGFGIRRDDGKNSVAIGPAEFLQEYIPGTAASLVAVADGQSAHMLGCFRQIVGDREMGAGGEFVFVGSIGPLSFPGKVQKELNNIANTIAMGCGLKGVFGIDFVVSNDRPVVVEINPRPTASCELLELATGFSLLPVHVLALAVRQLDVDEQLAQDTVGSSCFGKAYVFWNRPNGVTITAGFHEWLVQKHTFGHAADIPGMNSTIQPGAPVATVLASGENPELVLDQLRTGAKELLEQLAESQ